MFAGQYESDYQDCGQGPIFDIKNGQTDCLGGQHWTLTDSIWKPQSIFGGHKVIRGHLWDCTVLFGVWISHT